MITFFERGTRPDEIDDTEQSHHYELNINRLEDQQFVNFLAKFVDGERFVSDGEGDIRDPNLRRDMELRYRVYKILPEVTQNCRKLWQDGIKNREVQLPPEVLAKIDACLEKQVTQELNLGLIFDLQKQFQVLASRPGEIDQLKAELASIGNVRVLEQERSHLETDITNNEQVEAEAKRRQEGLNSVLANKKDAEGIAIDVQNLSMPLERQRLLDSVAIFQLDLNRLQANQNDLATAEGVFVLKIPQQKELTQALALFAKLENGDGKGDKAKDLSKLQILISQTDITQRREASSYFARFNEIAKKQRTHAMTSCKSSLERIINYNESPTEGVGLVKQQIIGRRRESQGRQEQLREMSVIAEGLDNEPWNGRLLNQLVEKLTEYSRDNENSPQVAAIIQRVRTMMDRAGTLDLQNDEAYYRTSVNYSSENLLKRLFTRKPETKIAGEIKKQKKESVKLERDYKFVSESIEEAGEKTTMLRELTADYKIRRQRLFDCLPIAQELANAATAELNKKFEAATQPDASYESFMEAQEYFDRLQQLEDDGDDEPVKLLSPRFLVKGHGTGNFKRGVETLMVEKAKRGINEKLGTITEGKFTPSQVLVVMKELRSSLGDFGRSPRYLELEVKAVRQLCSDQSLPREKRIHLGQVLGKLKSANNREQTFYQGFFAPAGATT